MTSKPAVFKFLFHIYPKKFQ